MPNLTTLILDALNEVARLKQNQHLLEIGLEQMDDAPASGKTQERLEILLLSHLSNSALYLNELETHLQNARKLVFSPPPLDPDR